MRGATSSRSRASAGALRPSSIGPSGKRRTPGRFSRGTRGSSTRRPSRARPTIPMILPIDRPELARSRSGERWEGKVDSVASGLRDVGGRQVGEVLGEIRDPSRKLPPNALVNVQIVIGEKKSALVVPRAALHRDSERRFVYLLRDGRALRRDVSVGLLGLTEVEITGGLQEGDLVILETQSPLAQGV